MTSLDTAYAAMENDPESDRARNAFYGCLAATELYLLLEEDKAQTPRTFETNDGTFVLAFDREDRLTDFTGGPVPYAALPGRAIAKMLSDNSIGIGLNLGVAPSSFLITSEAVDWMNAMLSGGPAEIIVSPASIAPLGDLPYSLLASLDARLATAQGLAEDAYLALVTYEDGQNGHLLAIVDAMPDAEPAITSAVSEAVAFSGIDAGALDVVFIAGHGLVAERMSKVGLRFKLPKFAEPKSATLDPTKPPKLR